MPGLVSFGSVWLTEPCRQVRIRFGSGSVRLENSGFGRFLTLTYPYTPLTYPYTPLTHLSPLQQPASNSSHNIWCGSGGSGHYESGQNIHWTEQYHHWYGKQGSPANHSVLGVKITAPWYKNVHITRWNEGQVQSRSNFEKSRRICQKTRICTSIFGVRIKEKCT